MTPNLNTNRPLKKATKNIIWCVEMTSNKHNQNYIYHQPLSYQYSPRKNRGRMLIAKFRQRRGGGGDCHLFQDLQYLSCFSLFASFMQLVKSNQLACIMGIFQIFTLLQHEWTIDEFSVCDTGTLGKRKSKFSKQESNL